MVEHRRLGGACRARVVVTATRGGAPRARGPSAAAPLLDQPQPEVHVAEQAPFVGRRERRSRRSARRRGRRRAGARRREAGRRAAADGAAPSRGRSSRRRRCARAGRPRRSGASDAGSRRSDARKTSSEKNRAHGRPRGRRARSRRRGTRGSRRARRRPAAARARTPPGPPPARLERADVELEPVAEPLDAAEHAHGVALGEPRVEQLDVVPHARLDAPARVDELEREVRRAAFRAQPLLARDRVDALDDAVFGELGDALTPRV